jgi:hypothetical protein
LRNVLVGDLKMVPPVMDESLCFVKEGTTIHGVMCVVVDDLCMVGDSKAQLVFDKIREKFKCGKWSHDEGSFCDRDIHKVKDGFFVEQSKKMQDLTTIEIPRGRRGEDEVSADLVTEIRNRVGKCLYISRETRPDMCCGTSMCSQSMPNPTFAEAKALDKDFS